MSCPYCDSDDGCEHLLLVADTAWCAFEAGELVSAIEGFHEKLRAKYLGLDDDNFPADVERRLFKNILDLAASFADKEDNFDLNDRPGLSQAYRVFYCSTAQRVSEAYDAFVRQSIDYAERERFFCV